MKDYNAPETELVLQTVHTAEVDRAFELVACTWESNPNISVDDMCEHLDAIGRIVTKENSLADFITENNITAIALNG